VATPQVITMRYDPACKAHYGRCFADSLPGYRKS